jgi:hypothetical protein
MLFRCSLFDEVADGGRSVQRIHEYEFSDPSEALAHFSTIATLEGASEYSVENLRGGGQWSFRKAPKGWRRSDT